jgi:hypothetical protein
MRSTLDEPQVILTPSQLLAMMYNLIIVLAGVWAFLLVFSFLNRLSVLIQYADYQPAEFVVLEVDANDGPVLDEGCDIRSPALIGIIDGSREYLNFYLPNISHSAQELRMRYPPYARLPVLYNSKATTSKWQGEWLRAIYDNGSTWSRLLQDTAEISAIMVLPLLGAVCLRIAYGRRLRRLGLGGVSSTPFSDRAQHESRPRGMRVGVLDQLGAEADISHPNSSLRANTSCPL